MYREIQIWQDKIRARPAVHRGLHETLGKWKFEEKMKNEDEESAKATRKCLLNLFEEVDPPANQRLCYQVNGFRKE